MNKLFGTDGIRGKADKYPLDSKTVWIIGKSLAKYAKNELNRVPQFIAGRDTRESGVRIERALSSGIDAGGGNCESAGVITTPGVAYLAGCKGFDAGIVISASHNPFTDNGLKIFRPSGKKIGTVVEEFLEASILEGNTKGFAMSDVHSDRGTELRENYITHFEEDFGGLDLSGIKIVADCANGAASRLAPLLFEDLGAEVVPIHNSPDGRNINRECGSLHLEVLQDAVKRESADFGVAFDGDADRSLFVDEKGQIVDGDATLWIMANNLHDKGKLKNDTVVATVMSNLGLEVALQKKSIKLVRTAVGDKYVLEELLNCGHSIGGEQSGHIIFPNRSLVGDGMQTALFVLSAMRESGETFSALKEGFRQFPQILVNVEVGRKAPFEEIPKIVDCKNEVEEALGETGRLLLRYSGTENLARVMIEGADQDDIEEKARRLASVIGKALG